MKFKLAAIISVICLIGLFGVFFSVPASQMQEFKAYTFTSSGDEIQGWYWLRDRNVSNRAVWTFRGLPEGTGVLEAEITALATDRASGGPGVDAHFRLLVGHPGSGNMGGVFCPQEVTLQNVSSPNDPDGYKCKGIVQIDRNKQCSTSDSYIFIFAERISRNHPHVAFNKDSIVLHVGSGGNGQIVKDDAGSGRDAGDSNQNALMINPGRYSGGFGSDDDEDWYKFRADKGQIISAELIPPAEADFDLYLKRPSGNTAQYSNSRTGERESINYVAGESGIYSLRIRRSSGEGNYQLNLNLENQNDANSGGDAGNDKNQALLIRPGNISGFLKDDDDEDWYKMETKAGQIIKLRLDVPAEADFDLYLHYEYKSYDYSNSDNGVTETLQGIADKPGYVYIAIKRRDAEGTYSLSIAPPSYKATDFSSTGEVIDGWNWLRDDRLEHTAQWEFQGIKEYEKSISFKINTLVSSKSSHKVDAQFLLLVFTSQSQLSQGQGWSRMVTLPRTGPAAGTGEYFCSGTISIPLTAELGSLGPKLIIVIKRISSNDPRVAFKSDGILIQSKDQYFDGQKDQVERELLVTPPDAFDSSATVSSGVHWCNREGHFLEWSWGPLRKYVSIQQGAVNLTLPVSNMVDGGPGFSARINAKILNLDGKEMESKQIELNNPFRPKSEKKSNGYGYDAVGVYGINNPEIIGSGFTLRLEWPPIDSNNVFGGMIDRAVLGFIYESKQLTDNVERRLTVADIFSDPFRYDGQTVTLEDEFHGWQAGLTECPLPKTRSDWLIGEGNSYMYATGQLPAGLSPTSIQDIGKLVEVKGKIMIDEMTSGAICPYVIINEVRSLE